MASAAPVLPDLSIRQLEYLVAVVDEPTWARAAARTGVSPSALSQGLAELERRVGVALFERVGRRRAIRPSAAPVVEHARQVLALTGGLTDWAARMRHGLAGRVRLGMIDAAAVVHFPDALQRFRAGHRDIELRLRVAPSRELVDLMERGELDLVVCVEPPHRGDAFTVVPLIDEPIAVYGPPGTDHADASTWGPWVMFPEGSHTRRVVADALARRGVQVDVVAESHQPEVLREMVRLGLGWTALPVDQIDDAVRTSSDRPLSRGVSVATRRLVALRRRGAVDDPAVDALVDELLRVRPVST